MICAAGKTVAIFIGSLIFLSMAFCSSGMAAETEFGAISEDTSLYLIAREDTLQDPVDDLDFLDEEDEQEMVRVADPLMGLNKLMFVFNDKAYFWVLKPVARGYKAVVPEIARKGVRNFFFNLGMPVRFVGCLLQGKGRAAGGEIGRFVLNTTVGVLGFGNPASKYPVLNPDAEDLGQTFGRYGIGNGIYLVWPILGPSTLRDSVGDVGDWFLDPVSYVDPMLARYSIKAADMINDTSLRIGEYESLKDAAIDPYTAFRDAYLQYRREKVGK
jgi:phospholipid-binding lipoprotein MlaA